MRHGADTASPTPDFRRIGILGAGLIGGSLAKGIRVSVASIPEEACRKLPPLIKAAMA